MLTRWLYCVWLVFAVGCVEDSLVQCEDGSACPIGTVCHASGCLAPAQLEKCDGLADLTACSTDDIPVGVCTAGVCIAAGCGNGVVEPTEACDDGNRTDRDGCAGTCLSNETCGNGYVDAAMGEECDDANQTSGDACQDTCKLPACGDGVIDASRNETCDDGASNSNTVPDACRTNCQTASCPDGVVDTGEACDDGDSDNGNGCRNDCVLPSCGNGTLEPLLGEACDDGNLISGDASGCQADCQLATCGDGVRDLRLNEACDEGTANSSAPNATCRPGCQLPRCGDGIADPLRDEACDDGNLVAGDGCRPNCTLESCGDGIPDFGRGEQCDDGNTSDQDGCRFSCKLPTCGDTITDTTLLEQCDDGASNSMMPNTCRPGCRLPSCGDGVLDPMFLEVCDDGNTASGDGCRPNCTAEVCGDSITDAGRGEQCDAGAANTLLPNAACRPSCKLPSCGDGIKDTDLFEECDAGANNSSAGNATCRPGCRLPRCGDNITDTTLDEQCDGTSNTTGFPCSAACKAQRCGNGIVDPTEQCDDGNTSNADACHTDCKLPTCGDGIRDALFNEQCDNGAANSATLADACRLTCRLPVCGDAVADTGEICDDGNTAVGDGCTPDCGSNETCGNGRLDTAVSEECDDTNQRSHDGCSSRCVLEFPRWTNVTPGTLPPRLRHAATYDAARGRLVVFGGEPEPNPDPTAPVVLLSDTWEYDGTGWLQRRPTSAPSARKDHALVYDATDGLVYLFGGVTASGVRLNDLWTWNGTTWTQIVTTGAAPPPRSEAAVIYDPARHRLVVFGGRTATGYLGDTWALQDRVWTPLTTGPSARAAAAVGYDPRTAAVVLYGGETGPTTIAGDSWVLTEAWSIANGSDRLVGAAMTWSPDRQQLVMFGGSNGVTTQANAYVFESNQWQALPTTSAPARTGHTLTAMIEQGGIVLVGGTKLTLPEASTWRLDRDVWAPATESLGPTSRIGAGVAYDPVRGATVMYGGTNVDGVQKETWEWNGLSWRQIDTTTQPRGSVGAMMAYAPKERQLLLQGGSMAATCDTGVQSSTWSWDGARWDQLDVSTGRAVCLAAAAPFDAQGTLVKIGGWGNGVDAGAGATMWTGAAWSTGAVGTSPEPVSGRTLAYDPERETLIQFGGWEQADTNKVTNKWWQWRGAWDGMTSEIAPAPRIRDAVVYDPVRQGVMVFGGTGFAGPLDDVWLNLRGKWQQVAASMPVTYEPWSPAITYHDTAAAFVAVSAPATSGGTTFTLRYESRTPDEACRLRIDRDGDGKPGIDDPDCWAYRNAICPPCAQDGACTCAEATCGDGKCTPLEDGRSCEQDCGPPIPQCGDYRCDAGEVCPGDCP